jgi:hypothetical protein
MVVSQRPFDPYRAGAKVYRAYRAAHPTDNPAIHLISIEFQSISNNQGFQSKKLFSLPSIVIILQSMQLL